MLQSKLANDYDRKRAHGRDLYTDKQLIRAFGGIGRQIRDLEHTARSGILHPGRSSPLALWNAMALNRKGVLMDIPQRG